MFFRMGQIFSMSVVQVGTGFPFLCDAVFKYLCEGSTNNIEVNPDVLAEGILSSVMYKVVNFSILPI